MGDSTKIIKGAKWSMIERLASQGVQFVLSIIIARLVLPSEYGLIAMLTVFLAVAQVFIDSGFSYSLLQKQKRTNRDFSTVFIFNVLLSIIIYFIFFCFAKVIADFYNESRLVDIIRVSFLVLIINSFSIVQRTKFQIDLNFKVQAYISLLSIIISGTIAVILAYMNYGVWALVAQSLLGALISSIGFWILGNWKVSLIFSKESFNELFSFGAKILGTMLMDTIYVNLYNLCIGKAYSSKDLGFYNRAFTLSQFPSRNLYNILNRVLFPVLCEQQNDERQQTDTFKKYIQLVSFIVFPLMIFLSFFSYAIIEIVLSEKWTPCAIYLSILSLAYMFYPIMASLFELVNSRGFSNLALKAEFIKKFFGVSIIVITIPMGIVPLCVGALITNLLDMATMIYFSRKVTPVGYMLMLRAVYPVAILAFLSGGVAWVISNLCFYSSLSKLCCGLSIMLVCYIGAARVFKLNQISLIKKIIMKV